MNNVPSPELRKLLIGVEAILKDLSDEDALSAVICASRMTANQLVTFTRLTVTDEPVFRLQQTVFRIMNEVLATDGSLGRLKLGIVCSILEQRYVRCIEQSLTLIQLKNVQ